MALPALINGADCGPLNPLQSLSKQFERDRGIQQDHFGPGRAGSSREVFRTQYAAAPGLSHEATQFFSGRSSSTPQHFVSDPFDLSSLRGGLPQQKLSARSPPSAWASDFLNQSTIQATSHSLQPDSKINSFQSSDISHVESQHRSYSMNNAMASGAFGPPMQLAPMFRDVVPSGILGLQSELKQAVTEVDFPPEESQQQSRTEPSDADELSRTAGLLIETVKQETNPKFQNSAFLGLMRQLRDKEMVVDGTDMVKAPASSMDSSPSPWTQDIDLADIKGKGKARAENGWADTFQETSAPLLTSSEPSLAAQQQNQIPQTYREHVTSASEDLLHRYNSQSPEGIARKFVHFGQPEFLEEDAAVAGNQSMDSVEDGDDKFWRQENAEYQEYWKVPQSEELRGLPEWDKLQADWDHFEATATGIKPVSVYQFQLNNPYLIGDSSTRNHAIHTQRVRTNESILEKEAAVQNDMRNPMAWFELGVKQQENEREPSAIQALQRAVELDPSYLEAWLALAISHTNESDRSGAYDAIENWVRHNERYGGGQLMASLDKGAENSAGERHEGLIQCLMGLARMAPDGGVDADIQTALGVLLNTSEDYEKAQDCFRAALAVRPNDWLLYNRVGATMANSGRSEDALWYYYKALELNPSYIRARFNLGISCINMKRYDEAAEHILDALVLQENDASNSTDTRGITSSALWECLRTTCMQLQRPELASLCDSHDLEGFRKAFWAAL